MMYRLTLGTRTDTRDREIFVDHKKYIIVTGDCLVNIVGTFIKLYLSGNIIHLGINSLCLDIFIDYYN